jgi:beta-lactam-binding protein with PASTA domain
MRLGRLLTVCALALGVAGCGAEQDAGQMPDVTGQQLDAALSAIESAGFTDDVDVESGGMFGVVDESNWQVCEQSPAAGEPLTSPPSLTVDRSCDNETDASPTPQNEASEPTAEATSSAPAVITATTDPAFADILVEGDYCSDTIAQFADEHAGQTIEFDGSVVAINNHDGYTTRYDILIAAGDYNETSQPGPAFQLSDVNTTSDMHWTNDNATSTVGVGNNLHVVAQVDTFDANSCLFRIRPVATSLR